MPSDGGEVSSRRNCRVSGSAAPLLVRAVGFVQPLPDIAQLRRGADAAAFGRAGDGFLDVGHLGPLGLRRRLLDEHLELERADAENIAGQQHRFVRHPLAVDERAVAAVQVADHDLVFGRDDHAVVPADGVALRPQVAIVAAADQALRHRDLEFLPGVGSLQNLQSHMHLANPSDLEIRRNRETGMER